MLDVQDLWNFVLFISQYCSRGRKDADGLFRVYLRNFRVPAAAATIYGAKFRPHYLAPLKELCNRKFKSRFIAELEGNGSARAVGHQERVLVESLEVLNHDLLQMRGIVCGWE